MKILTSVSLFILGVSLCAESSFAFKDKTAGVGLGYYSQNFLNATSQNQTGAGGVLGEPSYPFLIKYDKSFAPGWFGSSQLSYTLIPRETAGSTAKVTLVHVVLAAGSNFSSAPNWDWSVGPGIMQEEIKGKGGTTVMNNGTSTATFAIPGGTSTVRKNTLNFGTSWTSGKSRLALDLIFENAFSSSKRAQSFMFSYSYLLAAGTGGGGGGLKK